MGSSCCKQHTEEHLNELNRLKTNDLDLQLSKGIAPLNDIHEHVDMSIGIPSPGGLSSPVGKVSNLSYQSPSERTIKVEEKETRQASQISITSISALASITIYESSNLEFPLVPSKEFEDQVPKNLWETIEKYGNFKFRLADYPGMKNTAKFISDSDGKFYFGQVREEESRQTREGRGYLLIRDSQLLIGYLNNDLLDGPGVMVTKEGSFFKGIWKGGTLNGFGIYHGPDGKTYKGNWVNNLQEGYGEETWGEPKSSYKGYFRKGKRDGEGTLELAEEGSTYKGGFLKNQLSGYGTFKWSDGKVYNGEWKKDQMHGKGVFTWPDNRVYEGEYKLGKKEGLGTFRWPDGRSYEGSWKKGLQNGNGVYTELDGTKSSGLWVNGVKQDSQKLTPVQSSLQKINLQ